MAFSLDDYRDIKQIAKGGMGKVYLATQASLNRKVVIKEMASGLLTDTSQIRRFENEAKSAGSLDHDNIIRIYDFGEDRESFYIAMEFIDGPDLEQILHREDFVPEIGLMIAFLGLKGLHYAHEQGIIHRDVKPANIMISKAGAVKVLDFGLAFASARSVHLTATDAVIGTPHFMSPEQANGEEKKDIRMDVWSAGVLLYRIASNQYPFTGTTAMNVLYNILEKTHQPVVEAVPYLHDEVARTIEAALTKNPEKRLPGLKPMIGALQNYFYEMGVRDVVEMVRTYLLDPPTAAHLLAKLLVTYHMNKGKELYEKGDVLRSKAHVSRARRIDPRNTGVARTYKQLQRVEPGPTPRPPGDTAGAAAMTGKYERALRRSRAHWTMITAGAIAAVVAMSALVLLVTNARPRIAGDRQHQTTPAPAAAAVAEESARGEALEPESTPAPVPPEDTEPLADGQPGITAERQAEGRPARERDRAKYPRTAQSPPPPAAQAVQPSSAAAPAPTPARNLPGLVKFRVDPPNASVAVDGRSLSGPEIVEGKRLTAGHHMLTVKAPGYIPHQQALIVEDGSTHIVTLSLKPVEAGTGQLHVHSYPWAQVFVDGEYKGNAPTSKPLVLEEGSHSLRLEREGYEPYEAVVEIRKGEVSREKVQLEEK